MATALSATCVIAGGGPAGVMAGFLLARAGVDVIVLEKHKDFLRDFRGDTIHPSTMQVMDELGLPDDFLKVSHQDVKYAEGEIGGEHFRMADFTHLPTRCKFIAFMPQWDFLNFLSEKAKAFAHFHLMMEADAKSLLRDGERVVGVRVQTKDGLLEIHADLVIGADGRHSTLRDDAGLKARDLGAPMDVLWFRLNHEKAEQKMVLGRVEAGQMMVMLDRQTYWQCALIIRKGAFEKVKADGLEVQDAVAAAGILAAPLKNKKLSESDLAAVQKRRKFPTWTTQTMLLAIQNNLIDAVLKQATPLKAPWFLKLFAAWPFLQRIPARIIGLGFRPEHVGPGLKKMFAEAGRG